MVMRNKDEVMSRLDGRWAMEQMKSRCGECYETLVFYVLCSMLCLLCDVLEVI